MADSSPTRRQRVKSPFDILMLYAGVAVGLEALAGGYSFIESNFKSIAWLTFGFFSLIMLVGFAYPTVETKRLVKRLRTAAGCILFGLAVLTPVLFSQGKLFLSLHPDHQHSVSRAHAPHSVKPPKADAKAGRR